MPHIPLGAALRTQIHNQHARQLAYLKIDYEGAPDERQFPDYNQDTIVGWIKSNAAAIKAAKASQVTSPSADKPSWDSVLWSLVESAAVYLRKRESMIKAVNAARANDFNQALQYLKEAQEYVDEVADALDCDFIQLCDFAHQSPNGSWYHSGAYCGAFVSRESDNAIIGVAYKGTDNSREVVTDLDWDPSAGLVTGAAFGARIHSGFNKGLFGQFGDDNVRPFDLMVGQLAIIHQQKQDAQFHFTGHSLGGAYCTLTYGEFLRRQTEAPFSTFKFGDMYSVAAPRVCEQPFAAQVTVHTGPGKLAFRIVNKEDPVPTFPPRTEDQLVEYLFVHVDGGWHLLDASQERMATEQPPDGYPVPPKSIPSTIWDATDHRAVLYYESWQKTPHST